MTWTVTLPIDLPSANEHIINGNHAASASKYRRMRGRFAQMLHLAACRDPLPHIAQPVPSGTPPGHPLSPFRHVLLVRLWGKGCREWDSDNLVAAFKVFRDACQRPRILPGRVQSATVTRTTATVRRSLPTLIAGAGIVWDDSAKWSAWTYEQRRAEDGRAGVMITVRDAP